MKTIKSFFAIIMASVICSVTVSCSKDSYSSPLKGQTVNDVVFESSQSSDKVSIGNADLSTFTITSSENWCTVRLQSTFIDVSVQTNESYDDRRAIVTITDPEDGSVLSFNVIQKQKNALMIDNDKYKIPEEGGSVSIEVESNLVYTVEIPSDCTWLTLASNTRGLSKTTVTLNATKNDTGKDRKAIVRFNNADTGMYKDVTILQEIKEYFRVSPKEILAPEKGGEIEVSIETNVDYTIQIDESWIKAGEKIEVEKNKYIQKFMVSALSGTASRSVAIRFNIDTAKWSTIKMVTVTQEKGLAIENSNVKISVGDSYDLTLTNNTGTPVVWSSSDTSVATVDSKGLVKGVGVGKATITVKTNDGKYSDQIEISVVDITGFLSYGWSVASFNGWGSIGCTLYNNSNNDILLTKCSIYNANGDLINSTTDSSLLGTLKAGKSKGISINNVAISNGIKFVWEFTYDGKSYSYSCVYKSSF